MILKDFLPFYPDYDDENFFQSIFCKKEFRDLRLDKYENIPLEKGSRMRHQQIVERFISRHTLYNGLLLFHSPGTGKTCSAVAVVERMRESHPNLYNGAVIVSRGKSLLNNFANEIMYKCTDGRYVPEDYKSRNNMGLNEYEKELGGYYKFMTFVELGKEIYNNTDRKNNLSQTILKKYSNKIFIFDEVHHIKGVSEKKRINFRNKLETDKKYGSKKRPFIPYEKIKSLLHNIYNSRVLLLSGTPMRDQISEIAYITNLILPPNDQLETDNDFNNKYLEKQEDNTWVLKEETKSELKNKLRGYISVLKTSETDVKRIFPQNLDMKSKYGVQKMSLYNIPMEPHQKQHYLTSYNQDIKHHTGKMTSFTNSPQSSMFVFPDGTWGKNGWGKYINFKKTLSSNRKVIQSDQVVLTNLMKQYLNENGTDRENRLKQLKKCSSKYEFVIRKILDNPKKVCFVYSGWVKGGGLLLFSCLLDFFGYKRLDTTTGKISSSTTPNYVLFTGSGNKVDDKIKYISKNFINHPDNYDGKYAQVIIGSNKVSEGLTFKHVQMEFILTPGWNYATTNQAIARGIRAGSHNELKKHIKDFSFVEIYQLASIYPDEPEKSIDLIKYKKSENKDLSIQRMIRLLLTISFDCQLTKLRNQRSPDNDFTRECEYMKCEYKCEGVNEEKDCSDNTTYNLYYLQSNLPPIKQDILDILQEYGSLKLNILKYHPLLEKYRNVNQYFEYLESIATNGELTYNQYMKSIPVPFIEIGSILQKLFGLYFIIHFDMIMNHPSINNTYNSLSVCKILSTFIDNNIPIRNKYGLISFLREENDLFFLVPSISSQSSISELYNTEYPTIITKMNNQNNIESDMIEKINQMNDKKSIEKELLNMTNDEKQTILETVEGKSLDVLKDILSDFVVSINNDEDISFLKGMENLRHFDKRSGKWSDCNDIQIEMFVNHMKGIDDIYIKRGIDKKLNFYGSFNPLNDQFCIIKIQDHTDIKDSRIKKTGRVCTTYSVKDINEMRQKLGINNDKSNRSDKCSDIKHELEKLNLLKIDPQCGVTSKVGKTIGREKEYDSKKTFTMTTLIPSEDYKTFTSLLIKKYKNDSVKAETRTMMNECFGINKFNKGSLREDSRKWTIVHEGKKKNNIVGIIVIENNGEISKVCFKPSYDKVKYTKLIFKQILQKPGDSLHVNINNFLRDSTTTVQYYINNDFKIVDLDFEKDNQIFTKLVLTL